MGSWTGGWLEPVLGPKPHSPRQSRKKINRILITTGIDGKLPAQGFTIYLRQTIPSHWNAIVIIQGFIRLRCFCSCLLEKWRKKNNEFGKFICSIILLFFICIFL
ncbi:uncharacterized protein LOC142237792 isoform X2 [Haematobia irritans]|uniref:uncharacterized protein LOC142237792 isoform X2 n=1 Tax=Haematobia irritans TaxID=7368 RepID=UPI003F5027EF